MQLIRTINSSFADLSSGLFKDAGISKQEIAEIVKGLKRNYKHED